MSSNPASSKKKPPMDGFVKKRRPATLVDPVCAMAVDDPDAPRHVVNGVEYRFCSSMCRYAFAERPGRYLKFGEHLRHEIGEYRMAVHPRLSKEGSDE